MKMRNREKYVKEECPPFTWGLRVVIKIVYVGHFYVGKRSKI